MFFLEASLGVPLLFTLLVRVLILILRYLDPHSLLNAARAWKPFREICQKDKVLSSRIWEHVLSQKRSSTVERAPLYQPTPILRLRDRVQYKIRRVKLYRIILDEERKRGGEKIEIPRNAVRHQPYSKTKGIRL